MQPFIKSLVTAALALGSALTTLTTAQAETYPDKPIRLIVPTAAGGASDTVARVIGDRLRITLGVPIVVENRPGANGSIGGQYVLGEPADGYTLMVGHTGILAVNNHVYNNVPFDPLKAFAPVIWSVAFDNVLVANTKLPVRNAADLIQLAKSNGKPMTYGTPGYGTSVHMAMELFKLQAGVQIDHVPYKGMAPALLDLMAGVVDVAFIDPLTALSHLKKGDIRALGVSGPQRSTFLPEVPTIAESGLPGYAVQGWNGIVVKAGTPRDRIRKLNDHLNQALASPEVIKALTTNGAVIKGGTPEAFGDFVRSEYQRWADVVKSAKLQKI